MPKIITPDKYLRGIPDSNPADIKSSLLWNNFFVVHVSPMLNIYKETNCTGMERTQSKNNQQFHPSV